MESRKLSRKKEKYNLVEMKNRIKFLYAIQNINKSTNNNIKIESL